MSPRYDDPGAVARAEAGGCVRIVAGRRPNTTPARLPQLAPAAPIGDLAEVQFRGVVTRLHRLGPRVLAELLAEIGARYLIRQPIEATVAAYAARLDSAILAAVGADKFAPAPVLFQIVAGPP
jgi:hypothetical protein